MDLELEKAITSTPKRKKTRDFNIDSKDLGMQKIALETERYKSDTNDRKWLAKWATWVVTGWLSFVILILLFNRICNFNLSDVVLATLLGTTTLNVLGLSFIVLRGHFTSAK